MSETKRTQVGIIGAGPAGLVLSHLLHLQGIESFVLERRSRDYIESRVRAGVMEQGTVDLLIQAGVGERLEREAMIHDGVQFCFGGEKHRIALKELTGRSIAVYAQHEVIKDLVEARIASGARIYFETEAIKIEGIDGRSPSIQFRADGQEHRVTCDFVAACDGFHGIAREAMPEGVLTEYDTTYPFGWLGILADVPPSNDELIYASHEAGFALLSMRSPEVSRLYIQVDPNDDISNWPDERIWEQLHLRLASDGWSLTEGAVLAKGITPMRSFVAEPMQYGRLFLAGDASHIVPPTGAKGLNLAVADVRVLSGAISEYYTSNRTSRLDNYSATCLRRVWKVQRFSWWMTQMLHNTPGETAFDRRRRFAELDYLFSSSAAATALAENYVGLPMELD
jgi:p-hydroxybenzoate 3-monooxygenase